MKRTLYVLAVIVVVVCGALVYVGTRVNAPTPIPSTQPKPDPHLRVGGPKNIAALVKIASDRGLFAREHVAVDYVPIETGKLAMDGVANGSVDVGVVVDVNVAFLGFRPDGDVRVFASVGTKHDDAIVARGDRGVRTPSDLKRKRVGYTESTTSHVFLARYLAKNGVPFDAIEPVTAAPPALQTLLVGGKVDAIAVWQPFRLNAMTQLEGKAIELRDPAVYPCNVLLAARTSTLEQKRDAVVRLLRALRQAEAAAQADPDGAIASVAAELRLDPATLRAYWSDYQWNVALTPALLELLKSEGTWIHDTNAEFRAAPLPDYKQLIDPAPLRVALPDRVQW